MKILVYAHTFIMGGTQVNAIDLSAQLRDRHGHEILIYATPGPMVSLAQEKGLRFVPAPVRDHFPSAMMTRAFEHVLKQERPDVVQAWEMAQLVEAFYVAAIRRPVPLVGIDMRSDPVQRVLPKSPVTTYGTPEFVAHAVAMGRRRARLLVPPVDTRLNAPGITNTGALRARYGLDADELTLVAVSRLCPDMDKADGLARVIRAVQALAGELRLRFVLVGDGESRPALEQQAAAVNAALGRLAIVLTGEMLDPRAAYELADVVVGMGGSALRGMAFAKPVIVLGGAGFAELVTPQTASSFQYKGIYGIGDGAWENANLVQHLRSLAISPTLRRHLGEFSRSFVAEHFSLERVSDDLNRYCHEAVANPLALSSRIIDVVRTAAVLKGGHLVPSAVRNYIKRHESARASVIQEHELARARGSVGRVHRA